VPSLSAACSIRTFSSTDVCDIRHVSAGKKSLFKLIKKCRGFLTLLSVLIPYAGGRLMEWRNRKILHYVISFFDVEYIYGFV